MVSSTSLHLSPALTGFALLALVTLARSHESHESPSQAMDMSMDMEVPSPSVAATAASAESASYFRNSEYSSLMFAHIFLMIVGWVFVLPIAVMFSIARSRFSLITQFIFLAFNTAGVVVATIYNAKTPDLYPNNAHHKFSWWLTWIVTAQIIMAVISRYTGRKDSTPVSPVEERASFIPISTEALAEHQQIHDLQSGNYRISNDSGQGTEPNTESLRSHSISTEGSDEEQHFDLRREYEEDDGGSEKRGILRGSRMDKFLSKKLPGLLSSRGLKVFHFVYDCIDRVVLILAFVALTTGFVTYGGIFTGDEIFSGLAHFIKGGVFFWYGILTLGRWAGCFADIGWAWNIKPSKARKAYSAEFVESFLIFFYGSTNVFLEHLNAWGKAWTAQDLEHVSITIMFFGGGLCGMLIESTTIRSLLSTTAHAKPRFQLSDEEATLQQPKSYNVSMNPLPALVVLLLGLMMSSHTQHSMISSMIHKQWGTLLTGAAFARALTYVVFYLAPPTSIFPGRPPTELITAFCLMAGGMIFMVSAKDTVMAIENNNLDAMFVFTVSMGLITFLMAWIVAVIALKGWAVRREKRLVGF